MLQQTSIASLVRGMYLCHRQAVCSSRAETFVQQEQDIWFNDACHLLQMCPRSFCLRLARRTLLQVCSIFDYEARLTFFQCYERHCKASFAETCRHNVQHKVNQFFVHLFGLDRSSHFCSFPSSSSAIIGFPQSSLLSHPNASWNVQHRA